MLKDAEIRKAKPTDKPYKLSDGGGMFVLVTPAGGKLWRIKYRFDGKEKLLSIGAYPAVTLINARARRDEAKEMLAKGIDPGAAKQEAKRDAKAQVYETFGEIAKEFMERKSTGQATSTIQKKQAHLDNDLLPWLKNRPIKSITPVELLSVIRRVESRGANESAHRVLNLAGQIMRYAVATGKAERDPTSDLRGALAPVISGNHAAITDPKKVGELLRAIDGYTGLDTVRNALKLAALVFVRPGELRAAEWKDIDLENAEWRYTANKTKTDHIVPLATQAVAILREAQVLTGKGKYVFPSVRSADRPMSENTINAALRRLGYANDEMTGHGFRAMARTIMDEVLGERFELIEHQLAHQVRDANGTAYNRTKHLDERKRMMQRWADYLDKLKAGAEVIAIKAA